jgi:ceramide glucosyltransferase
MDYLHLAMLLPMLLALLALGMNHCLAWSFFARAGQRPHPAESPPAAIVMPVRGLDQAAEANFQSLFVQDYPNAYEVIFAVEDLDDPAIPVIQQMIRQHPGVQGRLVFSGAPEVVATGKIRNLIAGFAESRGELVVFVDSDVHLPPTLLRDAAGCVADPAVGLAFAAPVCEGPECWAAALHNLAVNASALQYVASAARGRLTAAVGALMVSRREVIEHIGGLEPLGGRVVGIDISLGQAVRRAGYAIRLLPQPARIYHACDTLGRVWRQMQRWLVTIRRYYPAFPIAVVVAALPLWWSLLFVGVALLRGQYVGAGLALVAGVLAAQVAAAGLINTMLVHDSKLWRYLWVASLSELCFLPIFVHSLLTSRVYWRGRWVRVNPDLSGNDVMGKPKT